MNFRPAALAALTAVIFAAPAQAQTEIQWWHAMGGALGEWVNDLAKDNKESIDSLMAEVAKFKVE